MELFEDLVLLVERHHGLTVSHAIQEEMMSGDYENLLRVFDREFGDFVVLER